MSVFDERLAKLVGAESKLTELERRMESLPKGGGDGTSGGMESRVAKLEKIADKLADQVTELRVDMGIVKTNIDHLPSKGFIFAVAAGLLAASSTVVALVVRFLPAAT